MRGLATGPLGVLVMVAPLVAIPILSTFGLPQFAPLAASPVVDAETEIIGPASLEEPASEPHAKSPTAGAPARTADDLFAPLDAASPRQLPAQPSQIALNDSSRNDSGLLALVPPTRKATLRKPRSPKTHESALNGWDVIPDASNETAPEAVDNALPGSEATLGQSPETGGLETEAPAPAPAPRAGLRMPDETAAPALSLDGGDELTWKGAQKRLNELGIRKFHLDSLSDGRFQFGCSVTDPENPQVDRRFVTSADEPLVAVEKALRQIETWRASQ